jgi:methylenetetrahydrofolate dehydrogenase (NADP+)/methenyltetrahydrofolate cyclohydrolase
MKMKTKILSGKDASKEIRQKMEEEISEYKEKYNSQPRLVIIQVGDDNASNIYIRNKIKACKEVGIKTTYSSYSEDTSEEEILQTIEFFNQNNNVEGIIVQTPLPEHISYQNVIKTIDPKKDVDGFHSDNMGRTCLGLPGIKPATALGVKLLLEHYNIDWEGKDICVIGRGQHVGLPISIMLGNNDKGTVTSCHINTKNLKEKTKNADIIISAVGKVNMVTRDMLKEGAIVIDVGMNRNEDGTICGDVDFEGVKDIVQSISPVPGGVGPMTVASLLMNTLWAYKNKMNLN